MKKEALLPPGAKPDSVLTELEPTCREATGNEPWTGVPKRFFGIEGDRAFFSLKQQGFQLRFGSAVTGTERQNIRGRRTHPEVVLTDLRLQRGTKIITIKDVDCVGREEDLC